MSQMLRTEDWIKIMRPGLDIYLAHCEKYIEQGLTFEEVVDKAKADMRAEDAAREAKQYQEWKERQKEGS